MSAFSRENVPDEYKGVFGYGDLWTWVGQDADSKLVLSWCVGRRENHEHALALHYVHYNIARPQKALVGTPVMAAGLADRVWSVEDIIGLLDVAEKKAA